MKYVITIAALLPLLYLTTCQEETPEEMLDRASLTINLTHLVDGQNLVYETQTYTNTVGERYIIQDFKYYLSNIKLRNSATGAYYLEPDSYHLVRHEEGKDFQIVIEGIPAGAYNEMEFAIGVDNGANTSTDKVGALDPGNQMAWDWNTGYKFLLLEGKFGQSEENLDEGLVYHIGGDANYRVLKFDMAMTKLENDRTKTVAINADAASIFAEPTPVSFSEHPVVMGDPFSTKVADNYAANMFQITAIE